MGSDLLGHSALAVSDLPRSIDFYRQLGFEPLWQDPDWAFLRSPGGWGLALLAPGYRGAGPHLGLHLGGDASLADQREACVSAGAKAVGDIHLHRDGSASFYASDPDGNVLEWVEEPFGGLLRQLIQRTRAQPQPPTTAATAPG
jgi:catechol 2,3-dioxygenase-like lactoylglutathione lyase family enzyme